MGEGRRGGRDAGPVLDTVSNITTITPAMYRESMGKVVAAKSYLRTWTPREY